MSVFRAVARPVWGWLCSVGPQRRYLGRDLLAGPPGAIGSVPHGMAAAILAGVNPVQGLHASFAGPITGGLTANTRLMVITTTSASALAAGSALSGVPTAQRPAAVPLVAIIAGAAPGRKRNAAVTGTFSDSTLFPRAAGGRGVVVRGSPASSTGSG
jgi:Sulfate permease family